MILLTIGKLSRSPEYDLCQSYLKRMQGTVQVVEFEVKEKAQQVRKQKESELLCAALKPEHYPIILDETGENLSTVALTERLNLIRHQLAKTPAFVIGGADGHTDELKNKAALLLCFGRLTWPHKLVRVMLLEQLYRCQQINCGHPYHRI